MRHISISRNVRVKVPLCLQEVERNDELVTADEFVRSLPSQQCRLCQEEWSWKVETDTLAEKRKGN